MEIQNVNKKKIVGIIPTKKNKKIEVDAELHLIINYSIPCSLT